VARWYSLQIAFPVAEAVAPAERAFAGVRIRLGSGALPACRVSRWRGADAWWLSIVPPGASLGTADEPLLTGSSQLDEVAAQLYARLRRTRAYRCALLGWEVEDLFMPLPESSDVLVDEPLRRGGECPGLVVSTEAWEQFRSPSGYLPFAPGYLWQPYRTLGVSGW
jgi:hypothetical protein